MTDSNKRYTFVYFCQEMHAGGLIKGLCWGAYGALFILLLAFGGDYDPNRHYESWAQQLATMWRIVHLTWWVVCVASVGSLAFGIRYWLLCRKKRMLLVALPWYEPWARWVVPLFAPWLIPFLLWSLAIGWLHHEVVRAQTE